MANLVSIIYLRTHDLEMACVTAPESQGVVSPGNQSLRKEEGRWLGEFCWPFFSAYSPSAPGIHKHPSHCLSGRLDRAGQKHTSCAVLPGELCQYLGCFSRSFLLSLKTGIIQVNVSLLGTCLWVGVAPQRNLLWAWLVYDLHGRFHWAPTK